MECLRFGVQLLCFVCDGQNSTIFIISGFLHQSPALPSPPPKNTSPRSKKLGNANKNQHKATKYAPVLFWKKNVPTCKRCSLKLKLKKKKSCRVSGESEETLLQLTTFLHQQHLAVLAVFSFVSCASCLIIIFILIHLYIVNITAILYSIYVRHLSNYL